MIIEKKRYLKVILLGDAKVGKTSLIKHFINRENSDFSPTIVPDFVNKEVNANGKLVNLRIWDTSGQERYQSLSFGFYRNTDICILVYDITLNRSFENLSYWIEDFKTQMGISNPSEFPFVLVGNKGDKHNGRTVPMDIVKNWCKANGNIPFFEASIRDKSSIDAIFEKAAEIAIQKIGIKNIRHSAIKLNKSKDKETSFKENSCNC
ncbi:unnamed protein product [Blepharisma stoltei]|uniref:Uncharacterized protein n=1 Tax=Blepharisma stoltei TaxID=1481888 RepID=A0AAU9II29_9CILI|nr:unnamed protein product [Blepharisma stoltei]